MKKQQHYRTKHIMYQVNTLKGMNNMDKKIQDVVDVLKEYNQEHIINLLNKLEEPKKQELLEQINKIDFHQIMELYDNTKKEIEIKENIIESIPYYDKEKLTKEQI